MMCGLVAPEGLQQPGEELRLGPTAEQAVEIDRRLYELGTFRRADEKEIRLSASSRSWVFAANRRAAFALRGMPAVLSTSY